MTDVSLLHSFFTVGYHYMNNIVEKSMLIELCCSFLLLSL